jgi:thioesterase domain-containing protein
MRLIAQVEREFGVKWSITSLFENPTIAAMAPALALRPRSQRRIVPIQTGGHLPPFFCTGAGPLFRDLASCLAPDRPFLGVAAPSRPMEAGYTTLEDLAADLAELIRTEQPAGPYVVGGWCIAGILAYEIARTLESKGQTVSCVVFFDTPNLEVKQRWLDGAPRRRWMELMAAKARFQAGQLLRTSPADVPRFLRDRVTGAFEHWDNFRHERRRSASDHDVLTDFDTSLTPLAAKYRPVPIRAQVLQFRPSRTPRGAWWTSGLGWESVGCPLDVVTVPGDHRGMLIGPSSSLLARELKRRLA